MWRIVEPNDGKKNDHRRIIFGVSPTIAERGPPSLLTLVLNHDLLTSTVMQSLVIDPSVLVMLRDDPMTYEPLMIDQPLWVCQAPPSDMISWKRLPSNQWRTTSISCGFSFCTYSSTSMGILFSTWAGHWEAQLLQWAKQHGSWLVCGWFNWLPMLTDSWFEIRGWWPTIIGDMLWIFQLFG